MLFFSFLAAIPNLILHFRAREARPLIRGLEWTEQSTRYEFNNYVNFQRS